MTALLGVLGGIGLFLLGMQLMTGGLQQAAGGALQQILRRGTRTTLRGILSGVVVTALVQSSTAVTVATLGFVNAGLLSLRQAVRVVFGSNLGTTMTAWIVALVGFELKIAAFALPLIGLGMLARLLLRGRLAHLGEAVAGFGVFFVGIDTLQAGFAGMTGELALGTLASPLLNVVMFFALGFALTALTQSSSAAIAIVISAAAGGLVGFTAAAAAAVGANVGTTSTAVLAALSATPNARRVAAAHVVFNIVAGLLALGLLALFSLRPAQSGPAALPIGMSLAIFHTLFNLAGVVLLWPFIDPLVARLRHWFRTAEEDLAQPRHLDHTLVATPTLALDALALELRRARALVGEEILALLQGRPSSARRLALEALLNQIAEFAGSVRLPEGVARQPALAAELRVLRSLRDALDYQRQIMERRPQVPAAADEAIGTLAREAIAMLAQARSREAAAAQALKACYQQQRQALLQLPGWGKVTLAAAIPALDQLNDMHRMVRELVKADEQLALLPEIADYAGEGAPATPAASPAMATDSAPRQGEEAVDHGADVAGAQRHGQGAGEHQPR